MFDHVCATCLFSSSFPTTIETYSVVIIILLLWCEFAALHDTFEREIQGSATYPTFGEAKLSEARLIAAEEEAAFAVD